jgi:ligand-binding SRPBCC domain-containing protein
MHRLEWTSFVPVTGERVWEFFADPRNLALLTPPEMRLEVAAGHERVREGATIDFRLRLLGLPLRWTSRIDAWEPGVRFVDVQVRGPYRRWRHEHLFRRTDGGTWIVDRVDYEVPLGAFGRVLQWLWIRRALERIFRHRSLAVARLLTDTPAAPAREEPRCA